jgi:hypothetical protein
MKAALKGADSSLKKRQKNLQWWLLKRLQQKLAQMVQQLEEMCDSGGKILAGLYVVRLT